MLINALCQYYDMLEKGGKLLPDGYSKVGVSYLICLNDDGSIENIVDYRVKQIKNVKGKVKEKLVARDIILPSRNEKPGISINIVEHRPRYIFGLNMDNGILTTEDKTDTTDTTKKSHALFVEGTLKFIEGLDTPIVNAYRNFLSNWKPEDECENKKLLDLKKAYSSSKYAFCLANDINTLLHEDVKLKEKYEADYINSINNNDECLETQCSISGKKEPIAKIHKIIKGVRGGVSSGVRLVCFNNDAESSYCNEQSDNSNISKLAMKKYTKVLNYLLAGKNHNEYMDGVTIVYWAMNSNEKDEDIYHSLIFGSSDSMDEEHTEKMIEDLLKDAKQANLSNKQLDISYIDSDVDFYIIGLKPNTSRLSLKFLYKRKFGEIIKNIARFQEDVCIIGNEKIVPFWRIKKELISPKSSKDEVNPALLAKIFESIVYGTPYPKELLSTVIRRVRTDDTKFNSVRAGLIKACINRQYNKKEEELKLALDKENMNEAYLCGRLFAVLEKIQENASSVKLNRTIKDGYFAATSVKPAANFPKLIRLSQNHLKKDEYSVKNNNLMSEIINCLGDEFPDNLSLQEQGKFMIGYYHQRQDFYKKDTDKNNNE